MKINVAGVQTSCSKPGCNRLDTRLDRHHRKSEKMFVKAFVIRGGTTRYQRFVERYDSFRPCDVVLICDWHHREIHELYWHIVERHKRKLRKHLHDFSWTQATVLMKDLGKACESWLKRKSPGSPPWPEHGTRT